MADLGGRGGPPHYRMFRQLTTMNYKLQTTNRPLAFIMDGPPARAIPGRRNNGRRRLPGPGFPWLDTHARVEYNLPDSVRQ